MKGLERKELVNFEKFISSSYFNSNSKVDKLFKILKKYYPDFDSPNLTKEKIYSKVYSKGKYNDTTLRKLFSDFYKVSEKFLVVRHFEKNEFEYNLALLDELDLRKIDNIFRKKYSALKNRLYTGLDEGGFHHEDFLKLHHLLWQNVSFHLQRGQQGKITADVFERSEQSIFYFLTDLFFTINDININKLNYNYEHPTNLPQVFIDNLNLESIHNYISSNNFRNKEIFSLHYFAFLMNRNFEQEEYFFKFRDFFKKNMHRISKFNRFNFILLMINYCIVKNRITKSDRFEKIRLELYEMLLQTHPYGEDKEYFRADVFLNVLIMYVRYHKADKAIEFLEKNIHAISPEQSKNVSLLGRALILFEKGDFNESLELASRVRSKDIILKMNLRRLLMKIDFELKDYDSCKESAENFRKFVSASKTSEINKSRNMEFIKNYSDLTKARESGEEFLIVS